LEHPKNAGYGGRNDLPREARVSLRHKWQEFFQDAERRELVQLGKPVPVTEDKARDLFSGCFHFSIEGGKSWPPEKR
jgi:hypothetical protein